MRSDDTTDINIAILTICSIIILCGFYCLIKSSRIFLNLIQDEERRNRRIPETPLMVIEKIYIVVIHPDEKIQLGVSL